MTDKWRSEAWCPEHSRIERVTHVIEAHPITGVENGIDAQVYLECNKRLRIATSPTNLAVMRQ